jgi:hypothetical protein
LGAIAEGGIPALQGYTEDEAQRRKDERALVGNKLATLGVGAQMSQAEAKAADDRAYRTEQAAIQREQIAAARDEARLTAAYRQNDLDLKKLELKAQIDAKNNPEKIILWKAQYGENGVAIGSRVEALTSIANALTDKYKEAARLAANGDTAAQEEAASLSTRINSAVDELNALSQTGQARQASTTAAPPPAGYIPNTR